MNKGGKVGNDKLGIKIKNLKWGAQNCRKIEK